jgi:hypothetical protein
MCTSAWTCIPSAPRSRPWTPPVARQRNRNPPDDPVKLVPVLGVLPPGTPVAFEAAYGWGWLVELLEELEQEPHLAHPSCGKAIAAARLKNDKVDARTLASCCGPTWSPSLDRPTVAWTATVASRSGSGEQIAASTTTSGQARLPMGHNGTATSSHPTVNPTATP